MHTKYVCHLCQEVCDCDSCKMLRAAPELLAVCRAAERWAMLTQTDPVPWLDAASSVIWKAVGGR
jgi:hypothetical protein